MYIEISYTASPLIQGECFLYIYVSAAAKNLWTRIQSKRSFAQFAHF